MMPIDELSKASARLGTFGAYVSAPTFHTITAKGKNFYKFQCCLIGTEFPETEGSEVYCMGVREGTKEEAKDALTKFGEGACWEFSKICIETGNTAYIHTPKKMIVDLKDSTIKPLTTEISELSLGHFPIPPNTLKDVMAITCTDVTTRNIGAVEPDATQPAAHTYREPPEYYTVNDAIRFPTVDRMGRNRMFQKAQSLAETRPLELTNASLQEFPWWLWLPTLGSIRDEVIGDGVLRIALLRTWKTRGNYICNRRAISHRPHRQHSSVLERWAC